jgi:hypothetical protein
MMAKGTEGEPTSFLPFTVFSVPTVTGRRNLENLVLQSHTTALPDNFFQIRQI